MPESLIKKILLVLVILIGCTLISVLIIYSNWRIEFAAQLESGSELAQTDKGVIEYASIGDKATEKNHLFILHDTPGGYDSGRILSEWLELDEQTHTIVPSRPGFLRTPIEVGATPREAAEAMIALMDKLGIEHTTVLGWGGGAATALEMAQRYPARIEGLVLLSPRAMFDDRYPAKSASLDSTPFDSTTVKVSTDFWGPDLSSFISNYLSSGDFPQGINNLALAEQRFEQLNVTAQLPSSRAIGTENDQWQFARLAKDPQYKITIPTLIIHSPLDQTVSFEHAQYLSKTIKQAQLYRVENESHLSTMNAQAVGRFHTFLERLRK
ncbi:MAG: alpha/beta hydrolase [Algicola sp.]|nr:alpha/beta hydrolase [Algicola sp.]